MSGLPLPSGAGAVMASRREPPDALDYFPTPPWATRALFRHVLPAMGVEAIDNVWEPACGEGHMAEVVAEFVNGQVVASDVFDYGMGQTPVDFLIEPMLIKPDWVITNPPFNLLCEFALRALEIATEGVALFAPFVERVPMVKGRWDSEASTATSYAWVHLDDGRPRRAARVLDPAGMSQGAGTARGSQALRSLVAGRAFAWVRTVQNNATAAICGRLLEGDSAPPRYVACFESAPPKGAPRPARKRRPRHLKPTA